MAADLAAALAAEAEASAEAVADLVEAVADSADPIITDIIIITDPVFTVDSGDLAVITAADALAACSACSWLL